MSLDEEYFVEVYKFLCDKERLRLFDLLYDAAGKRKLEDIHSDLGMKVQALYRYLPTAKKRVIPDHRTGARIVKALRLRGRSSDVIPLLDLAAMRMREAYMEYLYWRRLLTRANPLPPLQRFGKPTLSKQGTTVEIPNQIGTRQDVGGETLVEKPFVGSGFPLSSIPDNYEELVMEVYYVLNHIQRRECTRDMKERRIEEGITKLRELFLERLQ